MNQHPFSSLSTEEILDKLGATIREKVIVEDREYFIEHPGESDRLGHAGTKNVYTPYWAELWPASRMLARALLHEEWTPGTEALELGCGLGLPGIVALSLGLKVIFSDHDPLALRFASANAQLNGYDRCRVLQLDWRDPPADLHVPIVLASDVIYDLHVVKPLANLIKKVLLPGGLCLLADQNRIPAPILKAALQQEGLSFTIRLVRAGEPGGARFNGTIYRIVQPTSSLGDLPGSTVV